MDLLKLKWIFVFVLLLRSYIMYLRLALMMGGTWLMEAISFVSPDSTFFMITDILNAVLGVIIFVLFVLNRRVMHLIKKRFVNVLNSIGLNVIVKSSVTIILDVAIGGALSKVTSLPNRTADWNLS